MTTFFYSCSTASVMVIQSCEEGSPVNDDMALRLSLVREGEGGLVNDQG